MDRHHLAIKLFELASLPKTVYFCFRVFPPRVALKLPVMVGFPVKLRKLRRDAIRFENTPIRAFQVKIGMGETQKIPARKSQVFLEGGTITFLGTALFGAGISLANSGDLTFGDNFYSNTNCTIWCSERVSFGKDNLLGWNVTVRDSDGHHVVENGVQKPAAREILFGEHCWIGSECSILKGAKTGDHCIVGFGSTLTKSYEVSHAVLAGSPAVIKKEGIDWKR